MAESCYRKCPEIERIEGWISVAAEYGDDAVHRMVVADKAHLETFKQGCPDCPGPQEVTIETDLPLPALRDFIGRAGTRQTTYLQCPRVVGGEAAPASPEA